jgi:hypothetical protein
MVMEQESVSYRPFSTVKKYTEPVEFVGGIISQAESSLAEAQRLINEEAQGKLLAF